MPLIHTFPAPALQSTLRHRWAAMVAGSTSTLSLYRLLSARCLSISDKPQLLSRHVLQTQIRAQSPTGRRWYSSHTPPTSQQQSPFSLSRICEHSMIFTALYFPEMLKPHLQLISNRSSDIRWSIHTRISLPSYIDRINFSSSRACFAVGRYSGSES